MVNILPANAAPVLQWLERLTSSIASQSTPREIFLSLSLIAAASLALRIQSARVRAQTELTFEAMRQRRANFRNGLILGTLGLLGVFWGGEIRSFIISVAAIGAAAMIVSKELISNIYGSFIFTLTKPARIGDSIEIGAHRGELLDHNWLSLTLMEHGDTHYYTGKLIKLPTSILLTAPLSNYSQGGAYRFCTLTFHARQEHATSALNCAKQAAETVCRPWVDHAKTHLEAQQNLRLAQAPDAEPKASLVSVDKDSLLVSLRFPVPASMRAATCAEVSRLYFEAREIFLREEKANDRILAAQASKTIQQQQGSPL